MRTVYQLMGMKYGDYVCVENLNEVEDGVLDDDAGGSFAHEPIASGDVDRGAVQ